MSLITYFQPFLDAYVYKAAGVIWGVGSRWQGRACPTLYSVTIVTVHCGMLMWDNFIGQNTRLMEYTIAGEQCLASEYIVR